MRTDQHPTGQTQFDNHQNREGNSGAGARAIILGILLVGLALALIIVRGNSEPAALGGQASLNEGDTAIIEASGIEASGIEASGTESASEIDGTADDAPVIVDEDGEDEENEPDVPEIVNPAGSYVEPSIELDAGMVTLDGGQPDQQTADRIAGEIAAVVGAENVTNNYVIDTRAPAEGAVGILNSADTITYLDNSFRVDDPSQRQLLLTAYVLEQNPDAVVTISSHAASRGDALIALEASQTDADRLVVFFSEQDIEPERIIAIGLGSAQPVDEESPELPVNKRTNLAIAVP